MNPQSPIVHLTYTTECSSQPRLGQGQGTEFVGDVHLLLTLFFRSFVELPLVLTSPDSYVQNYRPLTAWPRL